MRHDTAGSDTDHFRVLAESFAVNERVNQFLIRHLNDQVWAAKPPGKRSRTIAAIFAHIHNVRRKWVRLSAPELSLPDELVPASCTKKQARAAMAASSRRCLEMIEESFKSPASRKFRRDGWAKPWPPGVAMVTYMISHEAHHRGQIMMLAHQLGSPLSREIGGRIWNWEKLWKECGFACPR